MGIDKADSADFPQKLYCLNCLNATGFEGTPGSVTCNACGALHHLDERIWALVAGREFIPSAALDHPIIQDGLPF